ncbi:DEAD/DEAH box helicase [Kitasatospora purpeofusca]|uniref:DEAD/DEAH box helicase n=1 Tax=Kitasatospora purpeofusca TaxID=67352 RepID=UPI0036C09E5E
MFTGRLFPYQLDAVQAVVDQEAILVAYSMGTGKTVITIAAVEQLLGDRTIRSALIIVPASLKWQWAQRIAEFTDVERREVDLRGARLTVGADEMCMVIHGDARQRAEQWEYVRLTCPDYVIASYNTIRNDWDQILRTPFEAVVLDEATTIKNFASQITKLIKRLQPPRRIALAGLPVENRPEEIYSIMEWVDPAVLGRWDLFDQSFIVRNYFGGVQRYRNLDLLHKRLRGSMIRKSRLDPEVAQHLPDVVEATRTVTLPAPTRVLYRRIMRDLTSALDELGSSADSLDLAAYYAGASEGGERTAQGRVMARVLAARLLLDDPRLLMDSAVAFHEGRGEGSAYIAELVASLPTGVDLLAAPKLDELDRQVAAMLEEPGAKVAIFSTYRRMLPYLAERLDKHADLVTFHGEMNSFQKAGALQRFSADEGCRIILSTNAGGYGVDLPHAQFLVNYDLPDSRGVYDQRNTRHVRASSTYEKVYVLNLIVEDSLEERQLATLAMRGKLAGAIVDGRGDATLENDVPTLSEHLGRTL